MSLNLSKIISLDFDKLLALNERKNVVARDLYDIYVILKKELPLDHEKIDLLFNKEHKAFTLEQTKKRIDLIKPLWKQGIPQLTSNFIEFETVKTYTANALSTFFH